MQLFNIKLASVLLLVFSFSLVTAQNSTNSLASTNQLIASNDTATPSKKEVRKKAKKAMLFQPASFVGGKAQLADYLSDHIKYPEIAQEYSIEGTMIVRFKVMEDGSLDHFSVKESLHPACDQKVITILQNMPNWNPAKQGSSKIAMWYEVPMKFSLK